MLEYKVMLETIASADLLGVLDYIEGVLKEPETALRFFSAIEEKVLSLNTLPHRHGIVQDEPYKSIGVRWIPVENYLAFYVIDEESVTVRVLRILYSRRNWKNLLGDSAT